MFPRRHTCSQGTVLLSRIQCTTWEYRMFGKDSQITYLSYLHLFCFFINICESEKSTNHIQTQYSFSLRKYQNAHKTRPGFWWGPRLEDMIFVYFHSIVFCLDFHQKERYLRKRGRKWDENKGRGREPSVMEPVPHWSRFSRRHEGMAPLLLLMAADIHAAAFIYLIWNGSTNN